MDVVVGYVHPIQATDALQGMCFPAAVGELALEDLHKDVACAAGGFQPCAERAGIELGGDEVQHLVDHVGRSQHLPSSLDSCAALDDGLTHDNSAFWIFFNVALANFSSFNISGSSSPEAVTYSAIL